MAYSTHGRPNNGLKSLHASHPREILIDRHLSGERSGYIIPTWFMVYANQEADNMLR